MVDINRIMYELTVGALYGRRTGNATNSAVGNKLIKKPIKTSKDQVISKPANHKVVTTPIKKSVTPSWGSTSE